MILRWFVLTYLVTINQASLGLAFLIPVEFVLNTRNSINDFNPKKLRAATESDSEQMKSILEQHSQHLPNMEESMMGIPVLLSINSMRKLKKIIYLPLDQISIIIILYLHCSYQIFIGRKNGFMIVNLHFYQLPFLNIMQIWKPFDPNHAA